MAKKKTPREEPMWRKFQVTMNFENRLCGSVPQSKKIVKLWLDARKPAKKPDDAIPIEELEKEVNDSIADTEERTMLSFQKDEAGLWLRGGTIKAHLKDCANQIKDFAGIKVFRSKVANFVYVEEYKVHIQRNGSIIKETDDSFEQPVHVMTAMGPRNALKIINFVEKPTLIFKLLIMQNKEVDIEAVEKVFKYGAIHGYGGERGMGEGRYSFSIKAI